MSDDLWLAAHIEKWGSQKLIESPNDEAFWL